MKERIKDFYSSIKLVFRSLPLSLYYTTFSFYITPSKPTSILTFLSPSYVRFLPVPLEDPECVFVSLQGVPCTFFFVWPVILLYPRYFKVVYGFPYLRPTCYKPLVMIFVFRRSGLMLRKNKGGRYLVMKGYRGGIETTVSVPEIKDTTRK